MNVVNSNLFTMDTTVLQQQQPGQLKSDLPTDSNYEDLSEDLLPRARESYYLEMVHKLKTECTEKSSECESLKIKLDRSNLDLESLSQELNQCKLTLFENNEDSRKSSEEMLRSKKLEEDYVKLMSDFLELGEKSEQFKLNLYDNYLVKTNAINNVECLMASGVFKDELGTCKSELENKSAELDVALARIRHIEEDLVTKDKCITELRKTLDDAKVTHKHEITVLEEYIQCLKNTITSYEKTLAKYIEPRTEERKDSSDGPCETTPITTS